MLPSSHCLSLNPSSASFPQFSYIRPGIQLFSPTNNSSYLSKPHSGMKGAEKPIGAFGSCSAISLLPA